MKNIRWIIALLLLVEGGVVFGQNQPTKASIMEDAFGAIRAEMVRDACNILEYNDPSLLGKISNQSINAFDQELVTRLKDKPDDLTARYLQLIVRDASNAAGGGLGGDDLSIYQTRINGFRAGLKTAYETGDRLKNLFGENPEKLEAKRSAITTNNKKYIDKIDILFKECQNYNSLYADGKLDEYKGDVFKPLIESEGGGTTSTPSKPKQENKPKPVEKSEEQIAFEGCNNWSSIESFMSTYPSSTYINDVDKKGWSICESKNYDISDLNKYLSVFGDNAKHKSEAQDKINQNDQQVALGKCNKLADYEDVLERWKDDPSYINKVYEKCWEYCEGRDKLEDYKKYIALLDKYGGTLHYKDAEEAINRLSTTPKKDYGYLWYLLGALAVVALLLVILLRKRKKNQSQPVSDDKELREENAAFERCSTISACDYYLNTYPNGRFVKEVIAKKEGLGDKMQKEEDEAFKACTTVTACDFYLIKYPKGKYINAVKEKKAKLIEGGNKPKPKDEPEGKPKSEPKQKQGEWVVVGASVKGNGHIESNMPCQDNNKFEILGKGWGVAVVSDGAGSAAHSELGSKVVVERGAFHFKNLVEKEGWMEKNTLPSDAEWLQKSYFVLKTIRNEVEMVAKKNNVDLKSLSATCLAVVFSPMGLLAVHVGDGRMGCKTASGGWKAIMTPHKGDEANQTLFLISEFWDIPNYVQSGVLVPESIVVREPVEAFAVMSDGCESTAWLCTAQNAETGKYYDQNKPFEGFFNPLEETLASFHKDNVPEEERKEKWYKFIESGTKGFVKEQDDKTMILGVFL